MIAMNGMIGVIEETALDPLGSVPPWWVMGSITALAIAASLLLARVGRARAFAGIRRWMPAMLVLIWIGVVAIWVRRLLHDEDARELARVAVLIVVAVAALPWLRNLFHALVFGFENRYRVGDDLRVGEIEGRVIAIGSRAVTLRAANGTEVAITHASLAEQPVVRLNLPWATRHSNGGDVREAPCEISLAAPASLDVQIASELACTAAALSPYAAPRVEPRVFVITDGLPGAVRLRLQGSVFDREYEPHYRSDVGVRFLRMTRDHVSRDMREPATALWAGEEP
jgi:hypothetical protein